MDKITSENEEKFINSLTPLELQEVLYEASIHQLSTREWLNSSWSVDLRRRVMERE